MNSPATPQPNDQRRRLRELLSVPERDRTDEQWDEIVELEIQLAPGNRIGPGPEKDFGRGPNLNSSAASPNGGPAGPKKHRPRSNNRRPKPKPPQPV